MTASASPRPGIALIGAGAVGTALALRLSQQGYPLHAVISRTMEPARALATQVAAPVASASPADLPADAQVVFCCVPDDAVVALAEELALLPCDWAGRVVAHTSGALTAAALAPLAGRQAATMSFHPLQAFPEAYRPDVFDGVYIGLEGEAGAVTLGRQLAADLGAQAVEIAADDKARYHLAASLASNFLVTLMALVDEVLSTTRIPRPQATALVRPLVTSTWNGLEKRRPEEVLTGPIARGDRQTVAEHLQALEAHLPHLIPTYAALAGETVRVAVRGGKLRPDVAQELLDVLYAAVQPDDMRLL